MGETVLYQIYELWLYIGIPIILGLAVLLWRQIAGFITFLRSTTLARLELTARQEISFDSAGHVVLAVEGPRWTARFRSLHFELLMPGGTPLEGHSQLMRERVTTFRRFRLSLIDYELPVAGRYTLLVTDRSGPHVDDGDHAILFLQPRRGELVARILAIVLTTDLLVGAVVFFVLRTA